MAENNLTEVTDGEIVAVDDINQSVRAFKGNVVPRNAEGVATNRAGSLGTPTLAWEDLHVQRILLAGEELEAGAGGGADAELFPNGVISGQAPTDRPGVCGWMLQAGSAGVRIVASTQNPLVVRVGGEEYRLTESIVGGAPLLAAIPQPADAVFEFSVKDESLTETVSEGEILAGAENEYMFNTGAPFIYAATGSSEVPEAAGDIIIFKSLGGGGVRPITNVDEYWICERRAAIGGRHAAYKAIRAAFNISSTSYQIAHAAFRYNNLQDANRPQIMRTGYVFIEPTASPWNIIIRGSVLGTTTFQLPTTANEGDTIYRQRSGRWHSFESGAWVQKDWVFLGLAAIETVSFAQQVVGVAGVRGESAIRQMNATAIELHAPTGDWDGARQAWYDTELSGTTIEINPPGTENIETVETRSPQTMINQAHRQTRSRFEFDVSNRAFGDARGARMDTARNGLFCIWLDAITREVFSDNTPPTIVPISVGRAYFAHQHRSALLLATYSADGSTIYIPGNYQVLPSQFSIMPTFWHKRLSVEDDTNGATISANNGRGSTNDILRSTDAGPKFKDYTNPASAYSTLTKGARATVDVAITLPTLSEVSDQVDAE